MYLDEADHVGIDDQPFYYDGMLNVFKMRSMLARMELTGTGLAEGKAAFTKAYEALRARGGGTISVYYHPNEWVQTEFWDAVNFSGGANPPRSQWKPPGTRPPAETEAAFRDFAAYLEFMKAQPGVRFVTASELMRIYQDAALSRERSPATISLRWRGGVGGEITFQKRDGYVVSAADVFVLLNTALEAFIDRRIGAIPIAAPDSCMGRRASSSHRKARASSESYSWTAFAEAVRGTGAFLRSRTNSCPAEIWIGSESLSPADYLATLAAHSRRRRVRRGPGPGRAAHRTVHRGPIRRRRFAEAVELADLSRRDSTRPEIMTLARLQAWTLKPALLKRTKNDE